jgi:site-specific recombinase XerD
MLHAGLRVGEVVNLDLGDVYLSETSTPHLRLRGKGDRERIIYLSATAAKLLGEYLTSRPGMSNEHLFLNRRGKPITITGIQLQLAMYCQKAGIWVTCHQLRHTFACRMIAAGVPVTSVQKMLGHASLKTTQLYIEVSDWQVEQDYHAGIRKLTATITRAQEAEDD